MRNQIDYIVTDGWHAYSVLDVPTFRGVTIDSDNYLVVAKIRLRIINVKNVLPGAERLELLSTPVAITICS